MSILVDQYPEIGELTVRNEERKVKCVIWDLDNTIWQGVLLEGDKLTLRSGVDHIITELDRRGILQSIASKNSHDQAMEMLESFGLADYFLYPQIHWESKAVSITRIAESLNIGIDSFAFVDDQPFERDEVCFAHPSVQCIDAKDVDSLLAMPEMNPRFITEDSNARRAMYLADIQRKKIEEAFEGPSDEFLATLKMVFSIEKARAEDLKRAEELTVRTHQLNTTGYTYSYEELDAFRISNDHILLIACLDDKYGTYGKIGLALVEKKSSEEWNIRLLLMSCRVMSRGVGSIMINHIRKMAKTNNVRLTAELISNDRNRMMYMTYRFLNFKVIGKNGEYLLFESDLSNVPEPPAYVKVITE